jgi:hypothetical protein
MARGNIRAFMMFGATRSGQIWRIALLYSVLTFLLAYPLTAHPATRVLSNGGDQNLTMWLLAWDTHAFIHQPFSIFDANIFYPQRHTLAYAENLIGSAFIAAPILWVTGNAVLATNVVTLLSCVLCALGAFVLARKLGLGVAAAVLSGIVFGFSPPRFFRIEQIHLTTIQWLPFCLAYLHAYLDEGRAFDLRLAVAFFTLQALTSGHGAALLVLAVVIVIAWRLATGTPIAPARRLRDFGFTGALLLVPTLLILIPYREVQTELEFSRALDEFVTNSSSFFASPSHVHEAVLSALSLQHLEAGANAYLFPGYLPLLLAASAFVRWRAAAAPMPRSRRTTLWTVGAIVLEILVAAAVAAAAWVTAYGAVRLRWNTAVLVSIRSPARAWAIAAAGVLLRIAMRRAAPFNLVGRLDRARRAVWRPVAGRPRSIRNRNAVTYLLLTLVAGWIAAGPSGQLWPLVYWLPGLNFIRVPSRFFLVAVLALAVLAAMGFERMTTGMSQRRRQALALIVGALMVAEFAGSPIHTETAKVEIPAIDRWLDTQPKPFVIAEVPIFDATRNSDYMLHSTAHWQKTVSGYSGMQTAFHGWLFRLLQTFPDEDSLKTLAEAGVTRIVVHRELYPPDQRARIDAKIASYPDRLTLVHAEGDGRVYALRR